MFDALKKLSARNCLVIQWLGFCAFTAKGPGSTPGQGSKIQQAVWPKQKQNKMKQKKNQHDFFFLMENIGMRIRNSGPSYFISILCNAGRFPPL